MSRKWWTTPNPTASISTTMPTITFGSVEPTGTEGTDGVDSPGPAGAGVSGVVGVDGVDGVAGVGAVGLPFSAATAKVEKPGDSASK